MCFQGQGKAGWIGESCGVVVFKSDQFPKEKKEFKRIPKSEGHIKKIMREPQPLAETPLRLLPCGRHAQVTVGKGPGRGFAWGCVRRRGSSCSLRLHLQAHASPLAGVICPMTTSRSMLSTQPEQAAQMHAVAGSTFSEFSLLESVLSPATHCGGCLCVLRLPQPPFSHAA